MTIRVAPHQRFTVILRETANDTRLSFKARGLLVWLLDKPDDWRVDAGQIAKTNGCGRDQVLTGLKELEEAGYLRRERYQDGQGRWSSTSTVYPTPQDPEPGTGVGFPDVGSADVGDADSLTKTVDKETPLTPQRGDKDQDLSTEAQPDQATLPGAEWKPGDPRPPEQSHVDEARGVVDAYLAALDVGAPPVGRRVLYWRAGWALAAGFTVSELAEALTECTSFTLTAIDGRCRAVRARSGGGHTPDTGCTSPGGQNRPLLVLRDDRPACMLCSGAGMTLDEAGDAHRCPCLAGAI